MSLRNPLNIYLEHYRNRPDCNCDLGPVFQQLRANFGAARTLYLGRWLHLTPSLFFSEVTYVDSLAGFANAMADPALLEYVNHHKAYPEAAQIRCYQEDYRAFAAATEAAFDLLISLNAGFVSRYGKRFLRPGGRLLVNDEHYDARRAWTDPDYRLIGAFAGSGLLLETTEAQLAAYFKTDRETRFTAEMVAGDAGRPPSRARFKPTKSAPAYLFEKLQTRPELP